MMANKTWRRVFVLGGVAVIVLVTAAWLAFWLMRPRPTICRFEGVDALQVGQAMSQLNPTEYESGLFGGSDKSTWSDEFKKKLAGAQSGTMSWKLSGFLSSTDGHDKIKFKSLPGGCTVEVTCWKEEGLLPWGSSTHYVQRERRILQQTYSSLKGKNQKVTAECGDGWRPSDPPIIESHEGAVWFASRNLPLDGVSQYFVDKGFSVDSRTPQRVELSGHFTNDPFGSQGVSLDERVVIKSSNGATVIGLWAAGSGQTTNPLGITEMKRVTSDDNLPAMEGMWNDFALRYSLQPLPPKRYAEKIEPLNTATTSPASQESE